MTVPFRVLQRDSGSRARLGRIETARGPVDTPQFMPVGTRASVKGVFPRDLREMGAQVILGNAFHLSLRPGPEVVRKLGGLHRMAAWNGPILTDSGGFQVFSLATMRTLDEDGVTFRSPIDGSLVRFTPEGVMEIQRQLGSDFAMVLDICPSGNAGRDEIVSAVDRTLRWAARALEDHKRARERGEVPFVLGIVQGGAYDDLRERCARDLVAMEFDAYAIGGVSVGEGKDAMRRATEAATAHLPEDLPRYLMGVGTPADFLDAIERGVDLFDCVSPTREGRNGRAYTSSGFVHIRNAALAEDPAALDPHCEGICCREYSRGTLRHLFHVGEMMGPMLLSLHNLRFFLKLMERARRAIAAGTLAQVAADVRRVYGSAQPAAEESP